MTDRIVVRDMVFYAYHGVYEAEREIGQRFEVDVELELDLRPAGLVDDIDVAVDYVDLYGVVEKTVNQHSFRLVEGLAEAIARGVLSSYEGRHQVEGVKVRVRKPHVPIGGLTGGVEVEIERGPGSGTP